MAAFKYTLTQTPTQILDGDSQENWQAALMENGISLAQEEAI